MPDRSVSTRRVSPWSRLVGLVALLAAALYGAAVALLGWGQERLIFEARPLPAGYRFDLGSDVHERWIEVPGARLNALQLQLPHADGVVFFLHGNGGNLRDWFVDVDYYRRLNLDLFMIDYRGYGKSSGHIQSQAQLMADVRAAWDLIAPAYAGRRRVIYGRSLGTGPAAILAAEVQPDLTVLVSPYTSLQALAGELYPWVPGAVLRYPLRTDLALARVHGRVLLVHGGRDALIDPAHSRRLLDVSPQARLLLVPQAGHADIHHFPAYLDGLAVALTQPLPVAEPAQAVAAVPRP